MKLLVIGGTHGNERLGVELVASLTDRPIAGVTAIIANPKAAEQNVRYVESDLNRSFGPQANKTYETERAAELLEITKDYDLVLDFHNTQTPANNCSFVGIGCVPALYEAAKRLKLGRCIEATYDCINKYALNTISIEISVGDPLGSVDYWRQAIASLLQAQESSEPLTLYRFERRVTWEERTELKLGEWRPFVPIPAEDKAALGLEKGEVAPIFIGSRLTPYYATLVAKTAEM